MSIHQFIRNNFKGYLSNRYTVRIIGGQASGQDLSLQATQLQMPGSDIREDSIGYWGREYKIPIVRSFPKLIVSVYEYTVDSDLNRSAIERWMNEIDSNNTIVFRNSQVSGYHMFKQIEITHNFTTNLASGFTPLALQPNTGLNSVTFYNAYPSSIGPLELTHNLTEMATYFIEFTYDYYTYV